MRAMLAWTLLLPAYLLGSISFAWLIARLKGVDLRAHGSGNLGATNVARALGGAWFFPVFFADLGKGYLAVWGSLQFLPSFAGHPQGWHEALLIVCSGLAAVLGHIFPLYHGLRGGKAVATSLGVTIALFPWPALIAFAVWLVTWLAGWTLAGQRKSDAVGLASVLAAISAPIAHLWLSAHPWSTVELPRTCLIVAMALLIVVRHRSNLRKLVAGDRAEAPPQPR